VLRDVSLRLGRGEALTVLGKNGMGKTTLLKTIFGLIQPRSGEILFEGSPQPSPSQLTALGVSYAPQEQPLFQDLSVRDNLRLALRRDSGLGTALAVVFEHFPFLSERLKQRAGTLSGGRDLSAVRRPDRPEGRHAVGRRAEDVDSRPRADGAPASGAAR
jgi:branched-chain amino acid transport system ATP-binding protein